MTSDQPEPMPGQMTVDECIEVAEKNLDGVVVRKPSEKATSPDAPTRPLTAKEVVARRMKEQQ